MAMYNLVHEQSHYESANTINRLRVQRFAL